MKTVTTLTMNPAIDLSSGTDQVVPDEKVRCTTPEREPGGGGINVARVIVRLGGSATAVYPEGKTPGQGLNGMLQEEGVPTRAVEIEGVTRESLTVLEHRTDRQFRFVFPGPRLSEEESGRLLERALEGEPGFLVASGSLPPGVSSDFYGRLAQRARAAGTRVVLDTSGEALRAGMARGVYLLKPNLRELGHLVGREVTEDPEQEEAARDLLHRGAAEIVVVSLGAGGALLATRETLLRIPSPTVPIRSRVGAGDSMVAGIVLALARGEEIAVAARLGVAAGAAAVMTEGTELCRRQDTERLFSRM